MIDKASNPTRWLGTACLALGLCVSASAQADTATKRKQVHHPETESHKSEAKANAGQAKAAQSGARSASKADSTHHAAHAATSHKKAHAAGTSSHHGKRTKPARGQQKIDTDRTRQIQEALIREHYLSGEPSGKWDAGTEEALRKLQSDNGWQNKTVPDSRALIKLGLGPNQDHLLNPESAMTAAPEAARVNPPSTASDRPAPAGQTQR
jgi:hypothetical protein